MPRDFEERKREILEQPAVPEQDYTDLSPKGTVDAGIRAQCAKSKQWEENLFRIVTSGWARRVWTAQEAVLAQRLCLEFVDGPVDVTDLLHSVSASDSVSRSPKPGRARLVGTYLLLGPRAYTGLA